MAEDRDKDTPSLEPPSLFGRKKKPARPPTEPAEPTAAPDPSEPSEPSELPEQSEPAVTPEAIVAPEADDGPTTIFDDTSEPTPDLTPTRVSPLTPPPAPAQAEEPRPPREPWLAGRPAAILTGLFVGALIVAATAGSLRICTKVKGTSSCGGPGFFLLVAILIVSVLIGTLMLRAAHVPEPGSTSFLAVGLLSVVALLFLVGSIFEWWMIIVIPLVSVATFLLSHWVTTTFVDPDNDGSDPEREPEPHDVR